MSHSVSCPSCQHKFLVNASDGKILPNPKEYRVTIKKNVYRCDCDSMNDSHRTGCSISGGYTDFVEHFRQFRDCLVAIQKYAKENQLSFWDFEHYYEIVIEHDRKGDGKFTDCHWTNPSGYSSSKYSFSYRSHLREDNFNEPGKFNVKPPEIGDVLREKVDYHNFTLKRVR